MWCSALPQGFGIKIVQQIRKCVTGLTIASESEVIICKSLKSNAGALRAALFQLGQNLLKFGCRVLGSVSAVVKNSWK